MDFIVLNKKDRAGNLRCGFHWSGSGLFGVLALVFSEGGQASLGATIQDSLAVLVHLQLDDQELRGVDADVDVGAVGLLSLYSLNVHNELLSVHLHNLADLVAFVVSADDLKAENNLC